MNQVNVFEETLKLPTYEVGKPEKNPCFFAKRVYQGSSGKVYPVPFIDHVNDHPTLKNYQSIRMENDFIRLVLLPELGGRIYLAQDKTNQDYDFFYRNQVIKPALVGLAGPWVSGGVEFNWPQHHRPGTFLPTDASIEHEDDGSATVWMSDHDPINRLKGMHGIRIRPDSSLIELRVRLYNRTPLTQTFLWWANVAAAVHKDYQSFFPGDVHEVADHACRATTSFPIADDHYYGIHYGMREGANDLTWYKNIPVPTSYMVCHSEFDFFGGFDHKAQGGFVHVANRHIAPGKKQWTWGDAPFGHAWDRQLTDEDGPYIELMAGVYTNNQPDFSYLLPYETKTFSQYWWPYKGNGPLVNASEKIGLSLREEDDDLIIGLVSPFSQDGVRLTIRSEKSQEHTFNLRPGSPGTRRIPLTELGTGIVEFEIGDAHGQTILRYLHRSEPKAGTPIESAKEPPAPADLKSVEELYLVGEHLEQYRHPTRSPVPYWQEGLNRDPDDSRCHTSLGRLALVSGQLDDALGHFRKATGRQTQYHPNPASGEAYYYLGLSCKYLGLREESYAALYKATWNYEWRSAAYYELACLDCRQTNYEQALEHLQESLAVNGDHNKAKMMMAVIARRQGDKEKGKNILQELLLQDPLDYGAQFELAYCEDAHTHLKWRDPQVAIDLAFDYLDGGFHAEAIKVLQLPLTASTGMQMAGYLKAFIFSQKGQNLQAKEALEQAQLMDSDYFFPNRLQEYVVLKWARSQSPYDANILFALGNYLFDRGRQKEAHIEWTSACQVNPLLATAQRNRGIAYWNVYGDGASAKECYLKAIHADPKDARLLFEYDQLRKKLDDPFQSRLSYLEERLPLVFARDDATAELVSLYNDVGQPQKALAILETRSFHPWEGGEGHVLKQYVRAHLLLTQTAISQQEGEAALEHSLKADQPPEHLGEAFHPLQCKAEIFYWQGCALQMLGRNAEAKGKFSKSAKDVGDFVAMSVASHSEQSYFRGLSLEKMGRRSEAEELFRSLSNYGHKLLVRDVSIDYFATSLPDLLVFDEDLSAKQKALGQKLMDLGQRGQDYLESDRQLDLSPVL